MLCISTLHHRTKRILRCFQISTLHGGFLIAFSGCVYSSACDVWSLLDIVFVGLLPGFNARNLLLLDVARFS